MMAQMVLSFVGVLNLARETCAAFSRMAKGFIICESG
jgi:hypothetical protein